MQGLNDLDPSHQGCDLRKRTAECAAKQIEAHEGGETLHRHSPYVRSPGPAAGNARSTCDRVFGRHRTRNALLRSARCLGERGFALLTQRWQTLQHVTASPGKTGLIARATLVLVLFEHKMLT